jgi:uncharacterized protein
MSSLTRRRFLQVTGAGAAIVAADMFGLEPRWLDVTEHAIAVRDLPSSLEGFTIAQITDAHLGVLGSIERQILARVLERRPSLIALTGDLVDDESRFGTLAELCSELRKSGARVVANLGNWEHWGRVTPAAIGELYARTGVELLVNASRSIDGVAIAATDDGFAGKPSFARTIEHLDRRQPKILLTHSPALLDRAPPGFLRFDLALAGHTHGGQARIGSFAPMAPPGSGRFLSGAYETPCGAAYVSRGTGTSVVPARLLCRPELPFFTLVKG